MSFMNIIYIVLTSKDQVHIFMITKLLRHVDVDKIPHLQLN